MKFGNRSLWAAAVIVSASAGVTGASWAQFVTTYSYDAQGQVTKVIRPTGAVSYTYDAAGNRVALSVTEAPPSAANASLLVPYQTGGSTWLSTSGVYTQIALVTPPSHGGATVAVGANGNPAIANYLPANGFYGADSFTYNVTGPGGTSATATVSITVSAP